MRLLFFILFILCFLSYNKHTQELDCKKFRTGTFKYTNPKQQHFLIVRNDSLQIESNSKNGLILKGSIEWKSDCEYVLTYIDVNNPVYERLIGAKFNINITSIIGNKYQYLAYDDKRKINGEIIKIE